jgi:hypothetical protein
MEIIRDMLIGSRDEGADIFIPASGVPMLVFTKQGLNAVDDAPVLNGVGLLVIAGAAAVVRHCQTGIAASRMYDFRLPPSDVLSGSAEEPTKC